MGRWQPDARGRLGQAAMELYGERGYDQTTVAEIAERAGLTERTFFRHFADKREVLFTGGSVLQDGLTEGVATAPDATAPIEAVALALETVGGGFFSDDFLGHARQRQAIIDAHSELQERELIKMATLSGALASALRTRGVPEPAATLTAEAGIVIFRVSFERWVAGGNDRPFAALIRESLDGLRAATAA